MGTHYLLSKRTNQIGQNPKESENETKEKFSFIVMSYMLGLSESITRTDINYNIITPFTTQNMLRQILIKTKPLRNGIMV